MDMDKQYLICHAARAIDLMLRRMVPSREHGREDGDAPEMKAASVLVERLERIVAGAPESAELLPAYRMLALRLHDLGVQGEAGVFHWAVLLERFGAGKPEAHLALGVLAYGREWLPGLSGDDALPDRADHTYDLAALSYYRTAEHLWRRRRNAAEHIPEELYFESVFYQVETLRDLGRLDEAREAWEDARSAIGYQYTAGWRSWFGFRLAEEAMRIGIFTEGEPT